MCMQEISSVSNVTCASYTLFIFNISFKLMGSIHFDTAYMYERSINVQGTWI